MKKINIVETTLRDGSYTVNNQFNAKETGVIAKSLEEVGFEYIEIGPGKGLNAKSQVDLKPASEDAEYIRAAKGAVENAKVGMFFIPGIGEKEDLKKAKENGLDFIRIGINITEYKKAFEYIRYAKQLGFITSLNLMKSYAVSSNEFANICRTCSKNGIEIIYLVDSAGGMLPEEVKEYLLKARKKASNLKFGFHGHNNMSLAIANSLEAVKAGVEFVDSTMRGMGRSSGNTITEKLILLLERIGYNHNINKDELFRLSEEVILPYTNKNYEKSSDYVSGFAQFHSSYLNSIKKISDKYNVSQNKLIVEYAKFDKVNINENKLEEIAAKLKRKKQKNYNFNITAEINHKEDKMKQLKVLKNKFIELKNKYGLMIFFNITKSYEEESNFKVSPVIHSGQDVAFGSAELKDTSNKTKEIFKQFKEIDGFLVDNRLSLEKEENIAEEFVNDKIYYYNDARLMAKSIYNYLKNIINRNFDKDFKPSVFLDVYDQVFPFLKVFLKGIDINVVDEISNSNISVVGENYLKKKMLTGCKKLEWLLLISPGKLDSKITRDFNKINLIRLDLKNEIFSEIIEFKNYERLFEDIYGIKEKNGQKYCSGGYIGKEGITVVDNINNITKKYGYSKGDGSIDYF